MFPMVIPRERHSLSRSLIRPEALRILYRLRDAGYKAYLCGGCVRDLLLQRKPKDFDLVTDARPDEIRRLFRNCRIIGRRFRLCHILFGRNDFIEVATFRSLADAPEVPQASRRLKAAAARLPAGLIIRDNVFGTPEEDALRRDFTVNALFYDISTFAILDYVNGMADLQARVLRCIGDPRRRYVEDPVRMIRAIRHAAALDLTMEKETREAISECRDYLAYSSPARLYEEMLKLLACGALERVYGVLRETGLMENLFPPLAEWLSAHPHEGEERTRLAARWLDAALRDGRTLPPALQIAIFFGPFHAAEAERLLAEGSAPSGNAALMAAVHQHFDRLRPRILVPRITVSEIAHLMNLMLRLFRVPPVARHPLRSRPLFAEALEYAAFHARLTGEGLDRINAWATTEPSSASPPSSRPPFRKRRRRTARRVPADGADGPQEAVPLAAQSAEGESLV